jgi:8-oxo-dGTP pyrophosphatase MutT (NUDIX family)
MKLLKKIYQKDLGLDDVVMSEDFKEREAVRAVAFSAENKIALLFVSKNNYHKLPGGGVDAGEDFMSALKREMMEEVGAQIEVIGELGKIIEYKNDSQTIQTSYCYLAKVIDKMSKPNFTELEVFGGFELKWVSLTEAVDLLKNDKPNNYIGKFIQARDLVFLTEAQKFNWF